MRGKSQAMRNPPQSETIGAASEKIGGVLEWISSRLPRMEVPGDHRHRIPAQLLDLSLDHAAAIVALIATGRHASAFALVRCQFECLVRGAWLHFRATDQEIEQFVEKDEIRPTMAVLIEALESAPPFEDKLLSFVKERTWGPMNGYTHGGIHQVSRRLQGDYIKPLFVDESLLEVLQFTGLMALVAFGEITAIAGRDDLKDEAQAMADAGAALVHPAFAVPVQTEA